MSADIGMQLVEIQSDDVDQEIIREQNRGTFSLYPISHPNQKFTKLNKIS